MTPKVTRIHCVACGLHLKHCTCPYPKQSIRIELIHEEKKADAGKEVIKR